MRLSIRYLALAALAGSCLGALLTGVRVAHGDCAKEEEKAREEALSPPTCSCVHAAATCVPLTDAAFEEDKPAFTAFQAGKAAGKSPPRAGACLYMVNAFGSDVRHLGYTEKGEKEFVDYVIKDARSRFMQETEARVWDEHVSQDGAIVIRAFYNKKEIKLQKLDATSLKINGKDVALTVDSSDYVKTIFLKSYLEKAELGDSVQIDINVHKTTVDSRYSWYRPRSGWAIDYSLANFAFVWPDWRFRGSPEKSIVPAMVEVEYRYYHRDGSFYLFPSLAIGPNVVFDKAEAKEGEKSPSGDNPINGFVGGLALDINGFKIGFGARWAWSTSNVAPMISLTVTEAVARGLNITDKFPKALAGGK